MINHQINNNIKNKKMKINNNKMIYNNKSNNKSKYK